MISIDSIEPALYCICIASCIASIFFVFDYSFETQPVLT